MFFLVATLALAAAGRVRHAEMGPLAFGAGELIKAHRGHTGPQLHYVGPDPDRASAVRGAVCQLGKRGWTCDIDADARVADYSVRCIPWSTVDDDYVAEGSCALYYSLAPPHPDEAIAETTSGAMAMVNILTLCFSALALPLACMSACMPRRRWRGQSSLFPRFLCYRVCTAVGKRPHRVNCQYCCIYVQSAEAVSNPLGYFPYTRDFAENFRGTVLQLADGAFPPPNSRLPLVVDSLTPLGPSTFPAGAPPSESK